MNTIEYLQAVKTRLAISSESGATMSPARSPPPNCAACSRPPRPARSRRITRALRFTRSCEKRRSCAAYAFLSHFFLRLRNVPSALRGGVRFFLAIG
jgi:hypothetical protein